MNYEKRSLQLRTDFELRTNNLYFTCVYLKTRNSTYNPLRKFESRVM